MSRKRWLWLLGVASVTLFVVLAIVDRKVQDSGGPGIIPFELAGSSDRAQEILGEWDASAEDAARLSLWLDFPYLVLYGAFFCLAILAVRDAARARGWDRFARPGTVIAFAPIAAAAFDVVEDVFLLLVLEGHADSSAPAIATGFAIAKFIALAVSQAYLLGGLGAIGLTRLRASTRRAESP
jgi:hypothetical protein